VYHSTLGWGVIKIKRTRLVVDEVGDDCGGGVSTTSQFFKLPVFLKLKNTDLVLDEVGDDGGGGARHPRETVHVDVPVPGARPVHLIISMIKWIRTSRLTIKNSISPPRSSARRRSRTCHGQRIRYLIRASPPCVPKPIVGAMHYPIPVKLRIVPRGRRSRTGVPG